MPPNWLVFFLQIKLTTCLLMSSRAVKQKPPYLPFSVEEIACVTTLDDWTNCKVKVVGRLTELDPATGLGKLAAVGEGIKATIVVSLKEAVEEGSDVGGAGQLLQVLGRLEIRRRQAVLMVHIVKRVSGLDTEAYYRAVCRIQSFLPINIRRS